MTPRLIALLDSSSHELAQVIKHNPELLEKLEELELVIGLRLEQLTHEIEKLLNDVQIEVTDLSYLDKIMNCKQGMN